LYVRYNSFRKTQYYQQKEQSVKREEQLIEQTIIEMLSVQEERKKDQEHKDLYWFTFPQGLRLVLCQLEKRSTNQDYQDQFTQYTNTCNQQANTALHSKHPTKPYNRCLTNSKHSALH